MTLGDPIIPQRNGLVTPSPEERRTASPMSATLFRTQKGSGFTTCKAHLDGFSQSCIVRGSDQSSLFGVEGTHLYRRPRIRFEAIKVFNELVTSRLGDPAPFVVRARQTRITYGCANVDESAFGDRICDKVLRTVDERI